MFEFTREQWPVSVRCEDLENGAIELPASGLFVVCGEFILPASGVRPMHSSRCHFG